MKIFDAVTVGSALKDIMFYSAEVLCLAGKKFPRALLAVEAGAKIPIEDVHVNYGGGAMNVAVGLKNFGLDVAPIIRVGRDTAGREIFAELKKKKLATDLVFIDARNRSGFSIVIASEKDRDHTIFTFRGANEYLAMPNLRNFQAKWFHVSSLAGKDWQWEFDKVARQTRRGSLIAWNPGSRQLAEPKKMAKFLDRIEVLIFNEEEAQTLVLGLGGKSRANLDYMCGYLRGVGVANVIITRGARGLYAMDKTGRSYNMKAVSLKRKIVDTVGAGDAFTSGFLAGYIKWENFENALHLGLRNSAQVLTQIGAQNGLLKIKL